ncbi:MAG: proton-conducting transporter membrane subunit [Spirochaetes bacterium]|nr:proton-conducting transporter membrane subunit [Spirochaetota bacterium]
MMLFNAGILIILLGWIPGLALRKTASIDKAGMASTAAGCVLVLAASVSGLFGAFSSDLYLFPWKMPFGKAVFSLSPLSSLFLFIISLISGLAAIYAPAYLRHYGEEPSRSKSHWFFYQILVVSMMVVVVAQDAIFFMLAWELMSLSSFFLVEFRSEKAEVRRAGWMYLVFTHIGAAFLLAMFALLARHAGSFDFGAFRENAGSIPRSLSDTIFAFAIVGFGMKAGFFPAHIWLPEAHPSAPSHVSALMSGVMIKTAIYGILMMLSFLAPVSSWQGWLLFGIGLVSGIAGIGMAISRSDMKGLLAYSSVENVGIIAIALGIGLLGKALGIEALAYLGFGAALFHVLNHSLIKSLLFFGSGAIQTASGTLDINRMGGLLKRMPITGATMLAGAAAICGFPPFNGFISEFFVYYNAFRADFAEPMVRELFIVLALGGLALIGALAAYAFAKLGGIGLLGEPRSEGAAQAVEVVPAMYVPMIFLASLCLIVGLLPSTVAGFLGPVLGFLNASPPQAALDGMLNSLRGIQLSAAAFIALIALLAVARKIILGRKGIQVTETWGCGYDKPDARMQYTSVSFAEPFVSLIGPLSRPKIEGKVSSRFFPEETKLQIRVEDPVMDRVVIPVYAQTGRLFEKFSIIQHGNTHLYVLYIVLALLAALVWGLGL